MLKYIFFIAGFLLECTAAAFCVYSEWVLCIISIVIGATLMHPVVQYFSIKYKRALIRKIRLLSNL